MLQDRRSLAEVALVLQPYEFRADKFAYVALVTPWLLFTILFAWFSLFGGERSGGVWVFAMLFFALVVGVVLFIASYRVIFRDGTLIYRRPPWKTRSIKLNDVAFARSTFKFAATRGPYALVIEPKPGCAVESFAINVKYLSRQDLLTLREILGDKLADENGLIDRVTRRLRARASRN